MGMSTETHELHIISFSLEIASTRKKLKIL